MGSIKTSAISWVTPSIGGLNGIPVIFRAVMEVFGGESIPKFILELVPPPY